MAGYNYILDTGAVVNDSNSLLSDVQNEWKTALGQTLNVDASTPQGSLIAAEVIARTNVMKNNADLANVINPNLSYGVYLDAICAFLGIERGANRATVATNVPMSGNPGTVIQEGSRVQTSNGDVFVTVGQITIPGGGTISGIIQSQDYGNVPLPVGSLTILDGTIGWGSAQVTSGTVVTAGENELKDGQLKSKRNLQLAIQGVGSSAAIKASLLNVKNVTSCAVVENNTGQTAANVNGIKFTKGSAIWVCVAGTPTNADVAAALYASHQSGCPWDYGGAGMGIPVNSPNGVATVDPSTNLQYTVKWTTPITYDCYVNVTVKQNGSSADPTTPVKNAMVSYANGEEDGEVGLVVGASVSAFEMSGAVARQLPGMYIKSCSVACVLSGSPAPGSGSFVSEFVIQPYEQALLKVSQIVVTVI